MYISSDGTKKDVKAMNSEYAINALAKNIREAFSKETLEEFEKNMENIKVLYNELYERLDKFLAEKIEKENW